MFADDTKVVRTIKTNDDNLDELTAWSTKHSIQISVK